MRIKFNDKIYRLKEIESGVDSLMELVEEPQFKDGDFVYEDGRIMIFKSYPNNYHYIYYPRIGKTAFDDNYGIDFTSKSFRRATEEEKQELLDALAKEGKRWNAEKLCIEDIPEKPKRGNLAIFWDSNKESAMIGRYDHFIGDFTFPHRDHRGDVWKNAIKFESKEQYEKLLKSEI